MQTKCPLPSFHSKFLNLYKFCKLIANSCKIYSLWFLKMVSPSYAFFSQTLKLIASKVRRLPLYIQSCKQCYRHTTENLTLLYSVYTSTAATQHRTGFPLKKLSLSLVSVCDSFRQICQHCNNFLASSSSSCPSITPSTSSLLPQALFSHSILFAHLFLSYPSHQHSQLSNNQASFFFKGIHAHVYNIILLFMFTCQHSPSWRCSPSLFFI